jgi:adenosine deaminase
MKRNHWIPSTLALALLLSHAANARAPTVADSAEARTAAALDRIASSPPRLLMFFQAMPKGGDLHNHDGGVIYAEDFLAWAAADGRCIDTDTLRIADAPCDAPGRRPAAGLEKDYPFYSRMIDRLSTRGFEAGVGDPQKSGYDRFFATFAAFWRASPGNEAKAISRARQQAAADHVSYIELGDGAYAGSAFAEQFAKDEVTDFAAMLAQMSPQIPAAVALASAEYDRSEAAMAQIDGCKTAAPAPACGVETRFHFTAIRTDPPAQVFAQLAFGFALVKADPRFVAVNIAAPEHDPIALRDYALHMRMIAFLKARYPEVALSLHAGEITLGLVPPRDLAFHIEQAVMIAGASRIGHGIDIAYETNAAALLKTMAERRIAVEINLTSNAVILGVKGSNHPLSLYREAGVPFVLSTDDEGVSRSDMTNEYLRAVTEQGLRYRDLKQSARNGLRYSFMPGASMWADLAGGARVAQCAVMASAACAGYLAANLKAAKEAALERDFAAFEAVSR